MFNTETLFSPRIEGFAFYIEKMETLYTASQIGIVLFGVGAIWLVGNKNKWQKYGYLVGLISQPFWFFAVVYTGQWGMFIVNVFYLISWINGFRNHFLRK